MGAFLQGAFNAVHPKKGQGMAESVVLLLLVAALVYTEVQGIDVSGFFKSVLGVVIGYFFGRDAPGGPGG